MPGFARPVRMPARRAEHADCLFHPFFGIEEDFFAAHSLTAFRDQCSHPLTADCPVDIPLPVEIEHHDRHVVLLALRHHLLVDHAEILPPDVVVGQSAVKDGVRVLLRVALKMPSTRVALRRTSASISNAR